MTWAKMSDQEISPRPYLRHPSETNTAAACLFACHAHPQNLVEHRFFFPRLAKKWFVQNDETPADIADRLGRDKSTITRLLVKRVARKKQGRKPILDSAAVDKLQKKLEQMIQKADSKYEVTVTMLKRSSRTKASEKTILKALHARKIYFRRLREKPVLTDDDIKDRQVFAKTYSKKTGNWWNKHIHLTIDVKHFKVLPHSNARRYAAQEVTRGVYRKRGQGLNKGYTKPVTKTKFNTGAKGIKVLAGVGNGKVLLWEYLDGQRWGGKVAADMYSNPMLKKLTKTFPERKTYNVLEDNDPSGFKTKTGRAAKKAAGITAFEIPKRSPCLNVCDYFLWATVNRRMREQEKKWPARKRETRKNFLKRLRTTALGLPTAMVTAAVADMKRRCSRLLVAKGGNIEEGGKGGSK